MLEENTNRITTNLRKNKAKKCQVSAGQSTISPLNRPIYNNPGFPNTVIDRRIEGTIG